uniref:Uncharacterized protein n=3 Tax=unclassified bacterial viruses TaxID=12333 RepID=A0AAU6W2R5_9VIRU
MTTNTLTTPLSLGQVAQYLAVAALIWFAFWVHDGAKTTKDNIAQEHACFDAAKTRQEVDRCFALIKLNISKE